MPSRICGRISRSGRSFSSLTRCTVYSFLVSIIKCVSVSASQCCDILMKSIQCAGACVTQAKAAVKVP